MKRRDGFGISLVGITFLIGILVLFGFIVVKLLAKDERAVSKDSGVRQSSDVGIGEDVDISKYFTGTGSKSKDSRVTPEVDKSCDVYGQTVKEGVVLFDSTCVSESTK